MPSKGRHWSSAEKSFLGELNSPPKRTGFYMPVLLASSLLSLPAFLPLTPVSVSVDCYNEYTLAGGP